MKLGLFGGTFNPVHFGHLKVVAGVQRKFHFDHIFFIPLKYPPHKDTKKLVSTNDRCEMIIKSIPEHLPFSLSYAELDRSKTSYSIDTVKHFVSKLLPEDELFFILGMDAFLEIHTWKAYKKLTKLVGIIIVSRPRHNGSNLKVIQEYIAGKLFSSLEYRISPIDSCWKSRGHKPIRYLCLESCTISSSLVREAVKAGKTLDGLVPSAVAQHIKEKGLYL